MTRARDIANLLGTNTNGIIDNAKITLDAAEVPNLAASKITSGTFADARIAASNVSQHASSFDDNKIVNDISTLAIRQASNENKGAYNTNSMYVDVFQDDTGIASNTNAPRNSDEYVNTVVESIGSSSNITSSTTPTNNLGTWYQGGGSFPSFLWDGSTGGGMWYEGGTVQTKSATPTHGFHIDLNGNYSLSGLRLDWFSNSTNGRVNAHYWVYKDTAGTWKYLNGTGSGSSSGTSSATSNMSSANSNSWNYITVNTDDTYVAQEIAMIKQSSHNNGNTLSSITELVINAKSYSISANATGNFISNTITAPSSTSKMGAIITYQNQSGTNALNSDIVLQLSADNGSNFTTATMTAMPDFATGIKMAKVNDLSVTAGTQLKYKISFANQSSGSKEARIRGVSLQY